MNPKSLESLELIPAAIAQVGDTAPADLQRRKVLRSGLAVGLLGGASSSLLAGCGGSDDAASTDTSISSFAIAVLPDTQFYSRYATSAENSQYGRRFGSEPFAAQTQWIAANARALNIPFTIHLGDVVDQVRKPEQWKVADSAMQVLEVAKLPYSVLAGNHDVLNDVDYTVDPTQGTDTQRTLANEPYLQWFGASRAKRQSTFRERDATGFHEYHVFTAQGQSFMVLSLSWRISDAGIAWARKVIAANPTLPVILVNHQLLNIDTDGLSPRETDYGKMLWERLIRDNDQIFMTLNGHHHGAARLTKTNNFGNPVEQMVVDYQMAYQGGNGLMRLYEFDLSNKQIKVLSFSPWVVQKPADTLNEFDQAVLTSANESFVIQINFAARFARFNSSFGTGNKTVQSSLVDQAKAALLANYKQAAVVVPVLPADAQDYPKVANTLAHWRFVGGVAGQPVPIGATIPDETGLNPLRREALNVNGIVQAELGDVVWSSDRHRLSAAPGSVRFLNTDKNLPRMSDFVTEATAPLNAQTLSTGYTVEAFIKIDKSWSSGKHAWMNILTRDGQRGQVPGFQGGDPEATPLLFAISSLREVQWEVVPSVANAAGVREPYTCWSGEVIADSWVHVAIVNDASTGTLTLSVEGAPVLRNAAGAVGVATLGAAARWVVGGGSWEGARADGYFGQIGEVRIVASALKPTQWLTARRS